MTTILLDVNVVLDVLLDRQPHVESAAALWEIVERGHAKGYLPAHAITTIHYLIRRERGPGFTLRAITDILRVFSVAPVDGDVLRAAATLRMKDFEDAVCAQAAIAVGCELLVTRDPAGYKGSPVPTLSPGEAVARLRARHA